jgi:hypothetical protein
MAATIQFKSTKPSGWISGYDFEQILKEAKYTTYKNKKALTIVVQSRANAPLNTLIRLLNVCNQLDAEGVKVTLKFAGKTNNLLGYCHTIGLLDCLSDGVLRKYDKSLNKDLKRKSIGNSYVSIHEISGNAHDRSLPTKLADKITDTIPDISEEDRQNLNIQFFSLFSELTRNVSEHSETVLNGFAALQVYRRGQNPRAEIVVCDSGIGLLESLKPSLESHNKGYKEYSDLQLIQEMLTTGISSKQGDLGGNGLCTCFNQAKATNSDMHIRLSESYYHLHRVAEHEDLHSALLVSSDLFEISGTFISFVVPFNK